MVTLDEIRDEFLRLEKIRRNNNWSDPRDSDNYILATHEYSFGNRNYYKVLDENYQKYKDLQASRGIEDIVDQDVEEYLVTFEQSVYLLESKDKERINELDAVLDLDSIDCFVELGFRTPRLLNYWSSEKIGVKGYDVVKINVMVSEYLGWDAEEYDLSLCEYPFEFEENSLIVSYHCFEHICDPLMALHRVYSDMKSNSFFHIEVPIENQVIPNLRYAHVQTFHSGDLESLLTEVGFEIINHSGGPDDRFLVKK